MNTYIVIAAYNESRYIESVITNVKKHLKNIIVVDDGSKDDTYDIACKAGADTLKHIVNMGKGAAIKTGCDYALTLGADKIILMDADGQHDPEEIPQFIKKLENNDIVFGYRKYTKSMPLVFRIGNKSINLISKLFFQMNITDSQGGFRGMTANAYKKVRWKAKDYSMESEMIANAGRAKLKYSQIQIKTTYSDDYKGTTVIDGVKIVLNMMWWRISR